MSRRAVFVPYRPKNILNVGRRADDWFWTRYSAYPYLGCQHGCRFCYCRERKYSPYADPEDFAYVIKVKENAAALLRRALGRQPVEAVFTGDYQPAERKFGISRQMLAVCLELGFPVFILERSPLVLRDLDLVKDLHARARAVVAFSLISTPDSPHYEQVRALEGLAPAPAKRFAALEQFARAGIPCGVCLMPVLPGLCDDDENLRQVTRWTAEHGGQFVLAGGLTLADQQRAYFLEFLGRRFPELLPLYLQKYPAGSYGAAGDPHALGRRVRAFCQEYGLADRVPRPVIPGHKRALNQRIAEHLANRAYSLELENAPGKRVWAYRRAFWAVEDLEQDLALIYRTLGLRGLRSIPNVGAGLAGELERLIQQSGSLDHVGAVRSPEGYR